MNPTRDTILTALRTVPHPDGDGDVVSRGLVSDPFLTKKPEGAKVMISLTVPAEDAERMEPLRADVQRAIEGVEGVASAMVAMTAERAPGSAPRTPPPPPPQQAPPPSQPGAPRKLGVEGVRHVIAVASGKGGVGKSTTAINLALGLVEQGLSVGILDADIYGPSLPKLMGLTEKPQADGRVLIPMERYGLKAMSIGFLIAEDTPMVWRGPMVISALTQLLREVRWEPLDVLVVDMPPGTGDAQLTMAQQVPLAGAVIVSTPQDLSLIDARKGLAMFEKVEVPILGIIENMSTFVCPDCGSEHHIFGHGGARDEAERLGVPFLGAVPLHIDIRTNSDAGTPVMASAPDGPHAAVYREIARQVGAALEGAAAGDGPAIVFE